MFEVKETQKHEDGSATFEVNGSAEDMQKLFEAFFTSALINGIDYAVEYKDKWIARKHLIDAALELDKALWALENIEGVDWIDIQEIVNKFHDAIKAIQK
ncbi:MAG: hypothetical protein ACO3SN_08040 [Burkholderiaceae bacterium]